MMAPFPDLWPALPELFLACAGMALLMIGVFRGENSTKAVAYMTVLAMLFAAVLSMGYGTGRVVTFNGLFVMDAFGVFMKVLVLVAAALSVILSIGYIQREKMDRFEFPVLMLFATLGMLMMISANDLISLYVGLETQSLALYVIAAFRRDSARSSEAGLKYFVLGALSSCLLLYGASLVYGFAGTTAFDKIAALFAGGTHPSAGVIIGLVFVAAGLAFKISAVPFHMWTPDVYEGAPTPVTAFFAVAPKIAAIALFTRLLIEPFGDLVGQWQQIIIVTSILSMALGSFAAITQNNIKRLMAYSSIGHIGYALVGLAAGTQEGVRGVLIYMAIYLFMNVGTFAVILCMKQNGRMVEDIKDLAGLSRTNPMLAAAMAIFMFSMAGIPPMAGFFSKLYVFLAAVEAHLYTLAVIGVLTSVVGAYYYLRIIKIMYFDEPVETMDKVNDDGMTGILVATSLVTLLFFVAPAPILNSAAAAAAALFAG
ncbi:NADH-quinone oxidoreductase subunit NuoN [Azospirillum sp. RWY-5-1]|uniref:NADH-quinone oxidoreductase subunit N n=1 Tax=Azospirillum oleiclasticum TaxID=2735135 RepID=A0ABX2T7Z7_9PROT|nr:NADH-quinone oxidoreductase subunit NuoN [Azospirillum oleiclasticum]NYZ12227.1 NADH-quinone oxidoreductase subunit NuoN [Azospirillum oleiclasticum]NYZ19387.1 NADH-quinone oxidoreductase subunit NuoN [Azospirillum oleiclasticum]